MASLLHTLLWLIGAALVFWLIWWLVKWVGVPEPFLKVVKVILGVAAVVTLIHAISRFFAITPSFNGTKLYYLCHRSNSDGEKMFQVRGSSSNEGRVLWSL